MSDTNTHLSVAPAANEKPIGGRKMKRQLTSKMLMASLVIAPLTAMPTSTATAQQVVRPSQDIVLSIGKGELRIDHGYKH